MKPTQRFIAGATCPNCHELDTMIIDSRHHQIECIECHYTQTSQQRDTKIADKKPPLPQGNSAIKVNSEIITIRDITNHFTQKKTNEDNQ